MHNNNILQLCQFVDALALNVNVCKSLTSYDQMQMYSKYMLITCKLQENAKLRTYYTQRTGYTQREQFIIIIIISIIIIIIVIIIITIIFFPRYAFPRVIK